MSGIVGVTHLHDRIGTVCLSSRDLELAVFEEFSDYREKTHGIRVFFSNFTDA